MTSTFVQTLSRLLSDPSLQTRNAALDAATLADLQAKVSALTPETIEYLGAGQAIVSGSDAPTGALKVGAQKQNLYLDTAGFQVRLSKFRDGLQSTPRKIRRRRPNAALFSTPADRVRYVMADPTDGVLCLDQNLEIVRTFPGLIPSGTFGANQYRAAECAVTATIDTQELMFIACGTQHAVQILDYQTGVLQYTIGTPGTPGLPSNFVVGLATPVSLAVDETNNRLFIACQTGDPGEISLEIGFVVEFDITNPGAPVFVQYVLQGKGMFRLNNLECRSPSDVFYVPSPGGVGAPPDRLFISNGLGDIAAFERPSLVAPFRPGLIIEAIGQDYVLGPDTVAVPVGNFAQNALDVLLGSDGVAHLSVAVSNTGTIERFRVSSGQDIPFGAHEGKMGSHQVDDAGDYGAPLRSYPVARPITYATFESATGVCADEVILPGQLTATPCLVATDAQGGKVQRLALPLYEGNHTVTFQPEVSPVSFRVGGWFLPSDAQFPAETLVVEVRDPGLAATLTTPAILPTDWREVPRASSACGVGDPLTRYQFRIRAVLDPTAPVRQYQTSAIGVILHQEW